MLRPRVGLMMGDPSGIGPELVARLLALPQSVELAEILLIGDPAIYLAGVAVARAAAAKPEFLEYPYYAGEYPVGKAGAETGRYVMGSIRLAVETLKCGRIDALVYGPLNKQAMKLAGLKHESELLLFAELLGFSGPTSEINVCGALWTSRVTSHIPLSDVPGEITAGKIFDAAVLISRALQSAGVAAPRIAVAALNPHAGEGGLLGTEENAAIRPAIEQARGAGIDASGPWPADTIFIAASRGAYDGVVTMYHDQGQIALKLLGFDRGVTVSGGLPVPITTPAHGTAYDIAGKGVADVGAMKEAWALACKMAARD